MSSEPFYISSKIRNSVQVKTPLSTQQTVLCPLWCVGGYFVVILVQFKLLQSNFQVFDGFFCLWWSCVAKNLNIKCCCCCLFQTNTISIYHVCATATNGFSFFSTKVLPSLCYTPGSPERYSGRGRDSPLQQQQSSATVVSVSRLMFFYPVIVAPLTDRGVRSYVPRYHWLGILGKYSCRAHLYTATTMKLLTSSLWRDAVEY